MDFHSVTGRFQRKLLLCGSACLLLWACMNPDMIEIADPDAGQPAGAESGETERDELQYRIKRDPGQSEAYSVVTSSNLFTQDRSFTAQESTDDKEPTPGPQQAAREIQDLKLVGTMSLRNSESFAFIIDQKNQEMKGKTLRYKTGDEIAQYTITNIRPDHVILKTGEELAILKLKSSDTGKPAQARGGVGRPPAGGAARDRGTGSVPPNASRGRSAVARGTTGTKPDAAGGEMGAQVAAPGGGSSLGARPGFCGTARSRTGGR